MYTLVNEGCDIISFKMSLISKDSFTPSIASNGFSGPEKTPNYWICRLSEAFG